MNDNSGCLYCGILVPKEQTKEESSLISSNPLMSVWYCPPRHLCPIWSPLVSPDSLHTRWPTSLEKSNPQIAKVVTCVCVCINSFKGATTNLDDFEDKVLHKDKDFKTFLFCFWKCFLRSRVILFYLLTPTLRHRSPTGGWSRNLSRAIFNFFAQLFSPINIWRPSGELDSSYQNQPGQIKIHHLKVKRNRPTISTYIICVRPNDQRTSNLKRINKVQLLLFLNIMTSCVEMQRCISKELWVKWGDLRVEYVWCGWRWVLLEEEA